MQPLAPCGQPMLVEAPVAEPRFWRVTYADLLAMWGEQGALRMLAAMERAYEQQAPAVAGGWSTPCAEPGSGFANN